MRKMDQEDVNSSKALAQLSKEAPELFDELVALFREITDLEEQRKHEQKQADTLVPPENEETYQRAKAQLREYKSGEPLKRSHLIVSIFYTLGEERFRELYGELDDATRKEVEAEINKPAK